MTGLTYIVALTDNPPYIREMAAKHRENISETGSKELHLLDAKDRLIRTFIGYKWVFITDSFGDWVAQMGPSQVCPNCHKRQIAAKPGKAAKFEYQLDDHDFPVLHCQHCSKWSRLDVDWKVQILTKDKQDGPTLTSGDSLLDIQGISSQPQLDDEGSFS